MTDKNPSKTSLGIFASASRIDAVLLRRRLDGTEVVGRFSRQIIQKSGGASTDSLSLVLPGLKSSEDADFTLQVGQEGATTAPTFLSTEFSGLHPAQAGEVGKSAGGGAPTLFTAQLREILGECHNAGFANPEVSFCVAPPDVAYVELFVPRDQQNTARKKSLFDRRRSEAEVEKGVDRKLLLKLLSAQHTGSFDAARVVFLPMTTLKGQSRYLAILPEASEPVGPTLAALQAQQRNTVFGIGRLTAELPLFVTLVRKHITPAPDENTAVIRVGSTDTMLFFLVGPRLRHVERLRSLSAFDPPETICRRVLLQQDEQKIGEIHHVLLVSDAHTIQFEQSLRQYYPNASIQTASPVLADVGLRGIDSPEDPARAPVVAAAVLALQEVGGLPADDAYARVDLLSKKMRRRPRRKVAVAWHTPLVFVLLFAATLYFTRQYLQQHAQIEVSRQELALAQPDPALQSSVVLKARVDSLRQVYQRYERALHILDSLLVGSDQWSRTLETTARATRELSGVWYESWQPNGSFIRLTGNARSRVRVAQLANRLDGEIEHAAFKEVNDVRIHPFTMVVPRPIGMPRIAEFLKEAVELNPSSFQGDLPISRASAPALTQAEDAKRTKSPTAQANKKRVP